MKGHPPGGLPKHTGHPGWPSLVATWSQLETVADSHRGHQRVDTNLADMLATSRTFDLMSMYRMSADMNQFLSSLMSTPACAASPHESDRCRSPSTLRVRKNVV